MTIATPHIRAGEITSMRVPVPLLSMRLVLVDGEAVVTTPFEGSHAR